MKSPNIIFILALILTLILGCNNVSPLSDAQSPQNNSVTYHIWVSCPECTKDLLYVNDCIDFLEKIKDTPEFLKASESINFDITKLYKVEKQINVDVATSQKEARCYYYSRA